MKQTFRSALLLALLLATAGCATVSNDDWTGTPDDDPPADLDGWEVQWDDQRRGWREHGSQKPVGASDVPTESWEAEQDALGFRIRASERLNFSDGTAHTAAVHILQARDPGNIKRQLEYPSEVYRMLRRGDDDPDVLALDRVIVEPGREVVMKVDRAERARYFVLIVGLTDYESNSATRIIEIPQIYDIPRGRERFAPGNVFSTFNPFASTPDPRPGRLLGWLHLGEGGVESLRMVAR